MANSANIRRSLVAASLCTGLAVAALIATGLTAAGAAAAPASGSSVAGTPSPTRTPRPIRLRPRLEFGHAQPGGTATYHQLLFNHLNDSEQVAMSGQSLRGWAVRVFPTTATTLPGYANIITVTVGVPSDPDHWIDLERTRGVLSGQTPFTTTAWLITITRRHTFTDVPAGYWADDPLQYLVDQSVISGYADGSFRPNEIVTRAQFAKMLVSALGWTVINPPTPSFSDVLPSNWAYGYIETAAAHGAISGYADGTFRPGLDVTRGQVAKMIFTATGWTMESPVYTPFTDVHPGDWMYTYVQAASSAEVMGGYADNSFRPNAPATRAQIAKILAYALFSDPNQ